MTPPTGPDDELGFEFDVRKSGEVVIRHHGRLAATLRGKEAERFVAQAQREDAAAMQQRMARLTGNYRRGNEGQAAAHPRRRC